MHFVLGIIDLCASVCVCVRKMLSTQKPLSFGVHTRIYRGWGFVCMFSLFIGFLLARNKIDSLKATEMYIENN